MQQGSVQVQEIVTQPPAKVWQVLGDFGGLWHPYVEWVRRERDAGHHLLRVFKARGEDTVYCERQTYFSDSDRALRYCHVSGIRDVESYEAECRVDAVPESEACARVTWTATFSATRRRVDEIAKGTEAVFRAGISAAAEMAVSAQLRGDILQETPVPLKVYKVPGSPRLAITATPPRPGPLLLFLHGIGGNRGNWRAQMRAAGRYVQAAALDLRGYGESELNGEASTIDAYCDDILRVMNVFGKEQTILCGLSYGSWIATSFAMRHPEKLKGLLLSGGCTGMSEASDEERMAFLAAREKPLSEGRRPSDFADAVVQVIAGPKADAAARQTLRASMASIPAATYRDAVHCFTHPPESFDFSRIACSVLMLTGEYDRLAKPSEIRNVAHRIHTAQAVPDVRFEVIADAGHVCNIESPQRYNELLCAFIEGLLP